MKQITVFQSLQTTWVDICVKAIQIPDADVTVVSTCTGMTRVDLGSFTCFLQLLVYTQTSNKGVLHS